MFLEYCTNWFRVHCKQFEAEYIPTLAERYISYGLVLTVYYLWWQFGSGHWCMKLSIQWVCLWCQIRVSCAEVKLYGRWCQRRPIDQALLAVLHHFGRASWECHFELSVMQSQWSEIFCMPTGVLGLRLLKDRWFSKTSIDYFFEYFWQVRLETNLYFYRTFTSASGFWWEVG